MALSSTKIVERASRLAATLANGPVAVEKNVLRGLVADFMVEPDVARLRRLLQLLAEGSGGHLLRGGGYGEQVQAAATELGTLLAETDLEPRDLQRLFGWTARLLVVRKGDGEPKHKAQKKGGGPGRPSPGGHASTGRPGGRRDDRRTAGPAEPAKTGPPTKLGAVSTKGLSALKEMKQRLREKEGKGE